MLQRDLSEVLAKRLSETGEERIGVEPKAHEFVKTDIVEVSEPLEL